MTGGLNPAHTVQWWASHFTSHVAPPFFRGKIKSTIFVFFFMLPLLVFLAKIKIGLFSQFFFGGHELERFGA